MLMYKSIAQEVAPYRIRVNSISPGAVRTPINTDVWETQEAYDKLMKLVPYRRIGEPRDIGQAVVWLSSDQSDYLVGTTLYVDGGMMLYSGFATGGWALCVNMHAGNGRPIWFPMQYIMFIHIRVSPVWRRNTLPASCISRREGEIEPPRPNGH